MPISRGIAKSIGRQRVAYNPDPIRISVTEDTTTTEIPEQSNYEIELGENVSAGDIGTDINGLGYKATNLSKDNKPAKFIYLESGSTGEYVAIQFQGNASISGFSAGDEIYLRSTGLSIEPLKQASATENLYVYIGYALDNNNIVLEIRPQIRLV